MSGSVGDTTNITVVAPHPPAAAATTHGLSFHSILSALNPLQLIPVVGSIYRAVTGDEGDPTVRFFGSLAVSGLTGGPIGLGINILEKITGIDPEAIAFRLLGIHMHHEAATATSAETPAPATASSSSPAPATATPAADPAAGGGWSQAALRAYGVSDTRLHQAGADELNGLELTRLHRTV